MKKFFSKFKNIYLDLLILYVIASICLYAVVLHINILGMKYLIPIAITLVILCIFNSFIIVGKRVNKKIKIFITVLFSLLTVVFFGGSVILLNVFSSVQNMFSANSYVEYSVMVDKDSKYKEIEDIDNKIVGFYQEDKYHDKAYEKLSKMVDCEYVGYSTLEELQYALLNDDIDALVILDSYIDVINGDMEEVSVDDDTESSTTNQNILDKIKGFIDKTRTIYRFKVKIDNSNNTKNIDIEDGSFTVFVSGQDSFASSVSEASRSDVNMLMVVNLKTKQVLLVSIPRDYYININGKNAYDKLTHISIYGAETAADSLSDLFDVNVDYYVKFNFTTFMKAVEYMLPLDVYSDYDFTTSAYDETIGDSYYFKKGYNHITTGPMALQFVRARKNFAEGDRQRGINQTRMLRAIINKASTPQMLLKYNDILKALDGTFLTNISDESIVQIIKYVINNNGKFNISSYSLSGSDAMRACYSSGSTPLYVMIPSSTSIDEASGYMKDVIEGRVPDIETDASELADPTNSATVNSTPYKEPYYPPTNKTTTDTTKDNKEKEKDEEKDTDLETDKEITDEENEDDPDNNKDNNQETENNDDDQNKQSEQDDNNSSSDDNKESTDSNVDDGN